MNQFMYGTAIVLLIISAVANAEPLAEQSKTETIPLDQVWAYRMPDTRDIQRLRSKDGEVWDSAMRSLLADVSRYWPDEGQQARAGFAVSGIGREALRKAKRILADGEKPKDSFSTEEEITLVFFSYQCTRLVEIRKVVRRGNEFEIHYRFVLPLEMTLPAHLALIPVGKLPAGKYRVEMVLGPSGRQTYDGEKLVITTYQKSDSSAKKVAERIVSGPFNFCVNEGKTETKEH